MKRIKVTQNILGQILINGKTANPQIQMAFKTTSDSLNHWRECDKERFARIMEDVGLKREAKAILESLK